MPGAVYLLCAATSLACAVLLLRGYRMAGTALMFWSSLCFFGLTIDNLLMYVDMIIVPDIDLSMFRRLVGLASVLFLIFGLVWETT
jgi:hypothetical protein